MLLICPFKSKPFVCPHLCVWVQFINFKQQNSMKFILFVLAVLAVLTYFNTKNTKKYERFYFKTLNTELAKTEHYLIDTLDNYPNDSLVNRLHELNVLIYDK